MDTVDTADMRFWFCVSGLEVRIDSSTSFRMKQLVFLFALPNKEASLYRLPGPYKASTILFLSLYLTLYIVHGKIEELIVENNVVFFSYYYYKKKIK